jgi:membrane protein implicated in regulation of membrane protease activity
MVNKNDSQINYLLGSKIIILIIIIISQLFFLGTAVAQDNGSDENNGDEESVMDSNVPFALAMIFAGVIILLAEPFVPGLFLAIPGTVLVTIGVIGLIFPDLMFSPISLIVGILFGLVALFVALRVYKFIAPTKPPTTTVGDSLIGKEGIITTQTDPDNRTKGKVRIGSTPWSASADSVIPKGTKVVVISSEGVHVKVKPIESEARRPRRIKS